MIYWSTQAEFAHTNLVLLAAGNVCMGIVPLVIGGILAAKLISGWLKHKGESSQATALKNAQDEAYNNQKANWDTNQMQRGERLNAVQGLLERTQPFLRSGSGAAAGTGPDYRFDPTVLGKLQKPQPFAGSHGADPRAGLGYGAASGAVGSVADALLSGYAGAAGGSMGSGLGQLSGMPGPLSGQAEIDPLTGRPRVIGG